MISIRNHFSAFLKRSGLSKRLSAIALAKVHSILTKVNSYSIETSGVQHQHNITIILQNSETKCQLRIVTPFLKTNLS